MGNILTHVLFSSDPLAELDELCGMAAQSTPFEAVVNAEMGVPAKRDRDR